MNAPTQFAGIAALEGPQDAVGEMVAAFDERRSVIVDGLNAFRGVTCRTPGGAFYTFPNVTGTGLDARTFQNRLLEGGGGRDGGGNGFGALGEGYVRFSYANSAENIRRALERVGDMLAGSNDPAA